MEVNQGTRNIVQDTVSHSSCFTLLCFPNVASYPYLKCHNSFPLLTVCFPSSSPAAAGAVWTSSRITRSLTRAATRESPRPECPPSCRGNLSGSRNLSVSRNVRLSGCLFVYTNVCISVCQSVSFLFLLSARMSVFLSFRLSISPMFNCWYVCLFICPTFCLPVCPSVNCFRPSVSKHIRLLVSLSICLYCFL